MGVDSFSAARIVQLSLIYANLMETRSMYKFLASLFLAAGIAGNVSARQVPVDGYSAKVNDRVITLSDVYEVMAPISRQLQMAKLEPKELQLKLQEAFEKSRETLIERALVISDFEADEQMQIPETMIDDRITSIINERFNNNRAEFLEALAADKVTIKEMRKDIKEQIILIVSRRREVNDYVAVSPKAVYDTYQATIDQYRQEEEVRVGMILINRGDTEEERKVKRKQADDLLTKLREGADFAMVAKENSEGGKADKGGDWGWISPTDFRSELVNVLSTMKPGNISDIVEVDESLYILTLTGRKPSTTVAFEDVKESIEKQLRQKDEERLYKAWINRLRQKYFIEVYD